MAENDSVKTSKEDVFKEFYIKLLKILPTSKLASQLYSHKLLSSDHKTKIDGLSQDSDKAAYFLDKVIKPGLEVGYNELFDETLRLMETSDDSVVVFVAEEIKRCTIGGASRETQPTALLPSLEVDLYKPKPVAKFSKSLNIDSAFTRMTSEIESILELKKFSKLRRACIQRINSLGSSLPKSLVPKIQQTHSLDDMLDVLAQSPYWNWFDTRLLQALISASGSAEAEEWLESFKVTFYAQKITQFIPYVNIKPFKGSINLFEKFDKDPKDLTISELLQHKYKLEYEVLDIDEGELVLSCIKTGCVELTWQIPQELVYRAYTSMKRKHDELSSLAVKSLICEEADEYAGLPILWRGQEVGEVGPIEPLPEHVRQEPYSLPQGFQWVTLSSIDAQKVVKFIHNLIPGQLMASTRFHHITTHPYAKSEWQFSVRTTNGKVVGVVLAYPVCMNIGGVSVMCVRPATFFHKKYHNKRLSYILFKECQRRANLSNINQFLFGSNNGVYKPLATVIVWYYHFTHPTSYQLPSSPRTPGWRKMTSEDVPSALALVNKYSSQFEIRQVFTSEEEFSHYFLSPTVPNFVFTYVVENEANSITGIARHILIQFEDGSRLPVITTIASTDFTVKQLLIDIMVFARNNSSDKLAARLSNVDGDVLSSLSFQQHLSGDTFCLYNYKYHEINMSNFWCTTL